MLKIKRPKSLIATLGLGSLFFVSSSFSGPASDEAAIRQTLADVTKAYLAKDVKGAMAPYAQDVVVFDIMPPLEALGYARSMQTTETVLNACVGPFTVDYSDINITIDHNHAYARYIVHVAGNLKDGRKIDMLERTTDVWEKTNGKWLIVHEHNSLPVDMVTGKAEMKAALHGVGVPFQPVDKP